MKQAKAIGTIKKIFYQAYGKENVRVINIHGSKFQEAGLPDWKILVKENDLHRPFHFWIEHKTNWDQTPTSLQQYNVKNLRDFGYITGYTTGNDFKYNWIDIMTWQLTDLLKKRY